VWQPKITLNIAPEQQAAMHGRHPKDQIILHETVSPNSPGTGDIRGVSAYLGKTRHDGVLYGIHGIVDGEGNKAWALDLGDAVFYHCSSTGTKGSGYANSRGIGIEQISDAPMLATVEARKEWWDNHKKLQEAVAEIVAWQCHIRRIPLRASNGAEPGVTTHWDVSRIYGVEGGPVYPDHGGGHWDCWPRPSGGHYPVFDVVLAAQRITKQHYG
jgi:hypothetical protein